MATVRVTVGSRSRGRACRAALLSGIVVCSIAASARDAAATAEAGIPGARTKSTCGALLSGALQRRMNALERNSPVPGFTAAFVLRDGTWGAAATGYSDPRRRIPLPADARMLTGSIGKTYVAAILLQLIAEGAARLDDPLSRYLGQEAWYSRLPGGAHITLRNLLNHTSGLRDHVYDPRFEREIRRNSRRIWRPQELVAYDLGQAPLAPAGAAFHYADTNYILLGMVIEKITGRPYYAQLRQRILQRFSLTGTRPSDRAHLTGLVDGYTSPTNPYGLPVHVARRGAVALDPQVEWTGGGLMSDAVDTARWGHDLYGGRFLPPAQLAAMLTALAPGRVQPWYGLGVTIWRTPLGTAYGHTGEFPGFLSVLQYFPSHGLSIALLFNTDDEQRLQGRPLAYSHELAELIVQRERAGASCSAELPP